MAAGDDISDIQAFGSHPYDPDEIVKLRQGLLKAYWAKNLCEPQIVCCLAGLYPFLFVPLTSENQGCFRLLPT